MKKFYSTISETASDMEAGYVQIQPRRSTLEFIRGFARACQSVRNEKLNPDLSVIILN